MNKIEYIGGDVTQPIGEGPRIIPQCCNSIGRMGSGVALAIMKRWPIVREKYRDWFVGQTGFGLGRVQIIEVEPQLWIANIVGQEGLISASNPQPIKYWALQEGLTTVANFALQMGASIHAPKLGSALAGGDWTIIEQQLIHTFIEREIDVTIYEYI